MDPQPTQFESILKDAMRVPADLRLEFIQSASKGDVALLSRLEAAITSVDESALETADETTVHLPSGSKLAFAKDEKIGAYVVEQALGEGGFGTVYKCRDETADRYVAIKVFSTNSIADQPAGSRFEAKANAKVRHPQIAKFLHTGFLESKSAEYLVYEFIDGPTLKGHLEKLKTLPPKAALKMTLAICQPLAEIHRAGLTHRDLKPDNILLDSNLKPHLLDFGLAVSEVDQLQMGDHVAGTAAYMSPEQLTGNLGAIDGRTDIWAVGVMLYQMLTGVLPFNSKASIAKGQFRPPTMRSPKLPLKLDAICKKCLTVDIDQRFNSIAELTNTIRRDFGKAEVVRQPELEKQQNTKLEKKDCLPAKSKNSIWRNVAGFSALAMTITVVAVVVNLFQTYEGDGKNPNNSEVQPDHSVLVNNDNVNKKFDVTGLDERSAAKWTLNKGGTISIDDWKEIRTGMPLPEGNFSLVSIDLEESDLEDSDLESLSKFQIPNLSSLDLSSTNVTDQGMRHLPKFRNLNDLSLKYNRIGDEGIKFVAQISGLMNLYIDETLVTDVGIKSLSKIKFRNLHLQNLRGVTDQSAEILANIQSLEEEGLDIQGTSITTAAIKNYGLDK